MKSLKYNSINDILIEQIQPYLGCTDISIIALGTALATQSALGNIPSWLIENVSKSEGESSIPKKIHSITLIMNESLYKTSHATAIPRTENFSGIEYAAVLGAFSNPEEKLNLFKTARQTHLTNLRKIKEKIDIKIILQSIPQCNLFLEVEIVIVDDSGTKTIGKSQLRNSYTHVTTLERNGNAIFSQEEKKSDSNEILPEFRLDALIDAVDNLPDEVLSKLKDTIELNTLAYEYGLKKAPGLGIGAKYEKLIKNGYLGNDAANLAASLTAAAEDVRMGGEDMPVMGIASSGSHGITSSIPIMAIAKFNPRDEATLLRSIALSFWITYRIKLQTGFLSAPCGCVISSGIGATAGITHYLGGNQLKIEQAMNHFIISTAGVICDGGKTTCSIKLANAASTAVQSAVLALEGVEIRNESGGIIRENFERNIGNLISISESMKEVDRTIVDILNGY
jgi:L-cysteine desulfidase